MDLVTGGAGFLGSHLVERLHAEGRWVRVLDRLAERAADPADRRYANVERWADRGGIDVIRGDVRDRATVRSALAGVERVFHLAAEVGGRRSVEDPIGTVDTNVRGTATLLQAAEEAGVSRVVFASSAAVLGPTDGPADEDLAPRPISPYGASLLGAEGLCSAWQAQGDRRAVVLRLSTVYGPRDRPETAVSRFLDAHLHRRPLTFFAEGRPVRDWLYVDDAVDALIAAGAPTARPGTWHVATGTATRVADLAEAIREVTGRRLPVSLFPLPAGDPERCTLDPSRAAAMLGWRARVTLGDGLARTWARVRGGRDPL